MAKTLQADAFWISAFAGKTGGGAARSQGGLGSEDSVGRVKVS